MLLSHDEHSDYLDAAGRAFLERAGRVLTTRGSKVVIPLHFEGWTHFTQGAEQLRASFAGYGLTERLRLPERGEPLQF